MKLAYNGFLANNSFNLSSTVLHNFKIIVKFILTGINCVSVIFDSISFKTFEIYLI